MVELANREEADMNCRSGMFRGVVTWCLLVGMLIGMTPAIGDAQSTDRLASKHYSRGVQYFNQGRYGEAQQEFDLATGYAPRDARIYFMRGMSKMRMGASYDAESDFQIGASVEVQYGRGDVGVALQRLQGSERLMIERYRREAKKTSELLAAAKSESSSGDTSSNTSGSKRTRPEVSGDDSAVATSPPPAPKRRASTYRIDNLQPDESDPFASSAVGFLGRGENAAPRVQQAINVDDAAEGEDSDNALSDDNPVGSGVSPDATADDDAFSDDGATAEMQPSAPATGGSSGTGKRSVFGAALRAMMRALPGEALTRQGQQMIPQIPGVPGGGMPPAPPAGQEAGPESASGNFAEPDPFVDEAPANEANEAVEADAGAGDSADSGEESTDDPFADEE